MAGPTLWSKHCTTRVATPYAPYSETHRGWGTRTGAGGCTHGLGDVHRGWGTRTGPGGRAQGCREKHTSARFMCDDPHPWPPGLPDTPHHRKTAPGDPTDAIDASEHTAPVKGPRTGGCIKPIHTYRVPGHQRRPLGHAVQAIAYICLGHCLWTPGGGGRGGGAVPWRGLGGSLEGGRLFKFRFPWGHIWGQCGVFRCLEAQDPGPPTPYKRGLLWIGHVGHREDLLSSKLPLMLA